MRRERRWYECYCPLNLLASCDSLEVGVSHGEVRKAGGGEVRREEEERGERRRGGRRGEHTSFSADVTEISSIEPFGQLGNSLKVDVAVFSDLLCVNLYNIKSSYGTLVFFLLSPPLCLLAPTLLSLHPPSSLLLTCFVG